MKPPENGRWCVWEGGDVYDVATAGGVDGALLPDRKKPALAPLSQGSRANRLFWSAESFCVGSCFPSARMQERKERVQHGLRPHRPWVWGSSGVLPTQGRGVTQICILPCRAYITTRRAGRHSEVRLLLGTLQQVTSYNSCSWEHKFRQRGNNYIF